MLEIESRFENFFKPEARSAGLKLAEKGVVNLSRPSDTELAGFIRVSSPIRVSIQSPSIGSAQLSVRCGCPQGRKGQLCKHAWAVLVQAQKTGSDFFEGKSSLDATASPDGEREAQKPQAKLAARPLTAAQEASREAMKERANEYRREQYQKQKARLKADKAAGKSRGPSRHVHAPDLPDEVKEAIEYFNANGFPFSSPPLSDEVQQAKKKLSRVFHPDKGGSHDEILELNRQSDLLLEFIEGA